MAGYLKKTLFLIPVIVFSLISITFYLALKRNNLNELPSALLNTVAPKLATTPLGSKEAPTRVDLFAPGIKFVNFWASWCSPCRAEHPLIKKISLLGYPIIGINYKDSSKNALSFLDELGDPYSKVGADEAGRTGIEWGLYGIPETFILNSDGLILLRHAGPITSTVFEEKFLPVISNNN